MSDGTLKLFAYYLLLFEKDARPLVFIEEPENGLYHKYLSNLALEMKNSVKGTYSKQLFITTHSPFFVFIYLSILHISKTLSFHGNSFSNSLSAISSLGRFSNTYVIYLYTFNPYNGLIN